MRAWRLRRRGRFVWCSRRSCRPPRGLQSRIHAEPRSPTRSRAVAATTPLSRGRAPQSLRPRLSSTPSLTDHPRRFLRSRRSVKTCAPLRRTVVLDPLPLAHAEWMMWAELAGTLAEGRRPRNPAALLFVVISSGVRSGAPNSSGGTPSGTDLGRVPLLRFSRDSLAVRHGELFEMGLPGCFPSRFAPRVELVASAGVVGGLASSAMRLVAAPLGAVDAEISLRRQDAAARAGSRVVRH